MQSKYICELHFEPESFMNIRFKNRLTPTAIPVPFICSMNNTVTPGSQLPVKICKAVPPVSQKADQTTETETSFIVKTPKKVYLPVKRIKQPSPPTITPQSLETSADVETPMNVCTSETEMPAIPSTKIELVYHKEEHPKITKMKLIIQEQRKTIKSTRQALRRSKEKVQHLKELTKFDTVFNNFKFSSVHSKAIATMQFITKQRSWTSDEKDLALLIYSKSPPTYKFLRQQGIVLPASSTVRHWISNPKFVGEFCESLHQSDVETDEKEVPD